MLSTPLLRVLLSSLLNWSGAKIAVSIIINVPFHIYVVCCVTILVSNVGVCAVVEEKPRVFMWHSFFVPCFGRLPSCKTGMRVTSALWEIDWHRCVTLIADPEASQGCCVATMRYRRNSGLTWKITDI